MSRVFRFEFEFKFGKLLKDFQKVKLVNQEWHLVNYVILDSMIHLGDGLIIK
jgi:hypothetical protein